MFESDTTLSSVAHIFDHVHLYTILFVFLAVGTLSMLGMFVLFSFRVAEEIVLGYYRLRDKFNAGRRGKWDKEQRGGT